jgi:uncharacterized protein (TIGR02217 family)
MAFFEVEFPTTISYRAVGGPGYSTQVNESFSGAERRNSNWANSRGEWQISLITPVGIDKTLYKDLLLAFFHVVRGRGDAFRLKDHKDFVFTNEQIGIGDGSTLGPYQLIKTYAIGGRSMTRTITKPITSAVNNYKGSALADTVSVKVGGVLVASANWSIDATTGKITFGAGHAPTSLAVITASGQFHFPVRFDADKLAMSVEESNVSGGDPIVSWNNIGLVEVRPPNY